MMLAPFLVILSAYLSRNPDRSEETPSNNTQSARRIVIPWFALAFVAVAALNSLAVLPKTAVSVAVDFDTVILAMAMTGALRVTARMCPRSRTAGIKPLALAALLFAWLVLGGAAINAGVGAVFV